VLGLLLVFDIALLVPFLTFVWGITRRPFWVVGAWVFFKATTIPIIFGTIHGFYKFFRKDDSFVNKIKPSPDVDLMNIAHDPEKQDS
jgi:hypothetical protein